MPILPILLATAMLSQDPISTASKPLIPDTVTTLKLTPPKHLIPQTTLLVGIDSIPFVPDQPLDVASGKIPSTNQTDDYNFLRYGVLGPQGFDKLGQLFDLDESERPWATTTYVHLLAPLNDPFIPFLTVAHEVDSLDEYDRYGIGGGTQINFTQNISFSTEILYFGDHSNYNETLSRETRMMARLQIEF